MFLSIAGTAAVGKQVRCGLHQVKELYYTLQGEQLLNRKVCAQCRRKSGYKFKPKSLADNPLSRESWMCLQTKGDLKSFVFFDDQKPPEWCIHKLEHAVAAAGKISNKKKVKHAQS